MMVMAVSACMLFCSSDVFAQRSRSGGGGSCGGGRMEGGARSVSSYSSSNSNYSSSGSTFSVNSSSHSYNRTSSSSSSCSSYSQSACLGGLSKEFTYRPYVEPSHSSASSRTSASPFSSLRPEYGKEVSKRTATRDAFVIEHPSGMFYFNDGIFYFQDADRYVIHEPYLGFRVPGLPSERREYKLKSGTYFYYYGTFYTYNYYGKYFEVIAPPQDVIVDWVPEGGESFVVEGDVYYTIDGVQYQVINPTGRLLYKVIVVDEKLYSKGQGITYYSCR